MTLSRTIVRSVSITGAMGNAILPRRQPGIQTEQTGHTPGTAINIILATNPRLQAMSFSIGGQVFSGRDLIRLQADRGNLALEELFLQAGLRPAAVAEFFDDLAQDTRSGPGASSPQSLNDATVDAVYQTVERNDVRSVHRAPTESAAALTEGALRGLSANAENRVPTRGFFELVGEAFLEFFAVIGRVFGSSWNPDTALMNGALTEAQRGDMRRFGTELSQSHGPMLQTILNQPNGRDRLRSALVDSGRPEGVTAATWAAAVDEMLTAVVARHTACPAPVLTGPEAEGVSLYLQANREHPEQAQAALAAFYQERTPPVSGAARSRALELLPSLPHWAQTRVISLYSGHTTVSREFLALPAQQQLVLVELGSRHGFALSASMMSQAMQSLSSLTLADDEARLLGRALSQLTREQLTFALSSAHGVPARLQNLSGAERRTFLLGLTQAARTTGDLEQALAGGGAMTVRNTRSTTLSATERRELISHFSRYDLSLSLADREGRSVIVSTHPSPGGDVALETLLADNAQGRALRTSLGVDTADLHRLLRNVMAEVRFSHSAAHSSELASLQQRVEELQFAVAAEHQPDLSAWTATAREQMQAELSAARAALVEQAPLSNLRFDLREGSALAAAFGLYNGRTERAQDLTQRTRSGVALSARSTVSIPTTRSSTEAPSLFAASSSNYFQSTTGYSFGTKGTQAVVTELRRQGGAPSVARVAEGYAGLDRHASRGVVGQETGVAAGQLGAWRHLQAADVRVVSVTGSGGGRLRTSMNVASRAFRESWRDQGGVSESNIVSADSPTKAELLAMLRAQLLASQPGQGVAFYFIGHNLVDRNNVSREGWMLANGDILAPGDLTEIVSLAEQRGVHLLMVADSCHGDSFVDVVRDRVRLQVQDRGIDTANERAFSQLNNGMRELFRNFEALGQTPDSSLVRLGREHNQDFGSLNEIERMVRAALAADLSVSNDTANAELRAMEERFDAAAMDFEAVVRRAQDAAAGSGAEARRARAELPGMQRRLAFLEARRDQLTGLLIATNELRSARRSLSAASGLSAEDQAVLRHPFLLGQENLPRTRRQASDSMGLLSDAIAAAGLREQNRSLA